MSLQASLNALCAEDAISPSLTIGCSVFASVPIAEFTSSRLCVDPIGCTGIYTGENQLSCFGLAILRPSGFLGIQKAEEPSSGE